MTAYVLAPAGGAFPRGNVGVGFRNLRDRLLLRLRDTDYPFHACAAVYGRLHIRDTPWLDGVPFQEASPGYPGPWDRRWGIAAYLREVPFGGQPSPGEESYAT